MTKRIQPKDQKITVKVIGDIDKAAAVIARAIDNHIARAVKEHEENPAMTASQRAGMIRFHERAARAYEQSGQSEQAARARMRAEALKAEYQT